MAQNPLFIGEGAARAPSLVASNEWFFFRLSLFGSVAGCLLAVTYWYLGSTPDVVAGVVSSAICTLTLVVWAVAGSKRRLIVHLALGALIAMFGAFVVWGSIAYLAWLGLVSIVAFMLLGRNAGLGWTAVILLLMGATLVIVTAPAQGASLSQGSTAVRMLRVIVLMPALATVGFLFEQQHRRNIANLERALAARSRLLAHVGHEMRTPLNGIVGLTQALRLGPLPASVLEQLAIVEQSGETLLALINDLLDVARAETGQVQFDTFPFDARAVVERTVAVHQGSGHLTFGAGPPVVVAGDAARFQQVVANLIGSALRHARGAPISLSLCTERVGSSVSIRLVVLTAQADASVLDSSESSLFICRSLARGLGGELRARAGSSGGTAFEFELLMPEATLPVAQNAPFKLAGRVLVVDDNAINRKVALALLSKLGLSVEAVESGELALELVRRTSPHLVQMDLQMPTLDGYATAKKLRAEGFTGPIIALTASAQPETAQECSDAGMNGCLVKPLRLAQVIPVLQRTLTR